jgi:hypothetical protein
MSSAGQSTHAHTAAVRACAGQSVPQTFRQQLRNSETKARPCILSTPSAPPAASEKASAMKRMLTENDAFSRKWRPGS